MVLLLQGLVFFDCNDRFLAGGIEGGLRIRPSMKEMVGGCCVCSDERGWDENPLVYCDGHGCNVAVHQGRLIETQNSPSLTTLKSVARLAPSITVIVIFFLSF